MDKIQTCKLLKLHQDDPVIQKCISLLEHSPPFEVTISEPTVANTQELKLIYAQRFKVHKSLNLSRIEVSETLFDDLHKENDEFIAVFEIAFPSEAFMIFADTQIKRVIGGMYIG